MDDAAISRPDLNATEPAVLILIELDAEELILEDPRLWHAERLRHEFGPMPAPIVLLGDFDPEPIDTRTIVDPFGRSLAAFEATFDRIDRCITVLMDRLARAQPARSTRAG